MASTEYGVFISYARVDNTDGWVTALCDAIYADFKNFSSEPFRIFLDVGEVKSRQDWARERRVRHPRAPHRRTAALPPIQRALDSGRQPAASDPSDHALRRRLVTALGQASFQPTAVGDHPGADQHYRDELVLREFWPQKIQLTP